jgi:hypothetical protein
MNVPESDGLFLLGASLIAFVVAARNWEFLTKYFSARPLVKTDETTPQLSAIPQVSSDNRPLSVSARVTDLETGAHGI